MKGKDKGKQGIVLSVVKEQNWCYVQGLNVKYTEHAHVSTPRSEPLSVVNEVKLVDPEDNQATDIEWKYTADGQEVRVSNRTGRIISFPVEHDFFTEGDNVNTRSYAASSKDTQETEVQKITFTPTLATFEQDLMNKYKIEETKKPAKTYWY